MRYIVATGVPVPGGSCGVKTEVVDLSNPSMSCLLEEICPYQIRSAGGLLGTTPVICGGSSSPSYLDECLLYGTNNVITMNSKRHAPSSVAVTNDRIWIMGGKVGGHKHDTTEFVTKDGAVNGPKLPEAVYDHCTVKFKELVYLIGGNTGVYTKNVWVANPSNGYSFIQGPSMMTGRYIHSCGTMSIGSKSIIIAAGGRTNNDVTLSSVEILDPDSNQWVEGE